MRRSSRSRGHPRARRAPVRTVSAAEHGGSLLRSPERRRTEQDLAGLNAQTAQRGEIAGRDRGVDGRYRAGQIQRALDRPAAGAFLLGRVQDQVDEWLAGFRIHIAKNVGGDLDEIRGKLAGVPVREDFGDLLGRHAERGAHDVIGFGDELHVAVLDAVVDHLDVMTAAAGTDVANAGTVGAFSRDGDEHRLEDVVGLAGATGHQTRSPESAKLTTGDTHADEVEILLGQLRLASLGVSENRSCRRRRRCHRGRAEAPVP